MKRDLLVKTVIVGGVLSIMYLAIGGLGIATSANKIPTETPSCILIGGNLDIPCLEDVPTERYPKEGIVDSDGIRGNRITDSNCIFGTLPSPTGFFVTGVNLEDTAEVCHPHFLSEDFTPKKELIADLQ